MATREKKRRSRGSGGVVKLSSGYYAYQYVDADGNRKTKSLRTKNRKEADNRVKDHEKAVLATDRAEVLLHAARARRIIASRDLPFAEVWSEFVKTNPTAGPGTLGLYERSLNEFIKWLNAERPSIDSFSRVDLETAIAYMERVWQSGVSASTYNDKRNALGLITKKLANRFGVEVNSWTQTERKKGVRQVRLPLTRDQVANLTKRLEDASGLPYPKEAPCLICLCLCEETVQTTLLREGRIPASSSCRVRDDSAHDRGEGRSRTRTRLASEYDRGNTFGQGSRVAGRTGGGAARRSGQEPERGRLRELAGQLPIKKIRKLLKSVDSL